MPLLGLFTYLALVASVSARCCTPDKYTAALRLTTIMNDTFSQSKGVEYADAVNGKYVTYANHTDDAGVSSLIKSYYNMISGDHYSVIGGQCTKGNFVIPGINKINPNCVPDNLYPASFTVGGPHEDLELIQVTIPLTYGLMQTTYTKHHCIPVHQITYFGKTINSQFKVNYVHVIDFSNLKPSVDDPSVFVLPDICKNVTS